MGNENPNDDQKNSNPSGPVPTPPQTVTPPAPQATTPNPGGSESAAPAPSDDYHDVAPGVQGRVSSDDERAERAQATFDETVAQN